MSTAPLTIRGLRKTYGSTVALDGVDLTVQHGHVHALLGPNGAGKTTLVRTSATLTRIGEGEVSVAGRDVRTDPAGVRRAVGLVGQSPALDEKLHGRENLVLFARLHGLHHAPARARAEELLERFGLTEAADRPVSTYSGGMRRRLDIATGLVLRPVLLFLDEPTTGLDPRARADVWDMVREVVAEGTTVLLTTQHMEEADRLADRITVLRDGRVVAEGTPTELKSRLGGDQPVLTLPIGADAGAARESLARAGITGVEVDVRQPTLDEVFLHLTETDTVADTVTVTEGAAR
ncbi:ATP-binding cassette domain-containing protein [Nocardioides sp. zg-1308]|uniref:ABC transporter ATP-binding protein n=1 Tax=Nocardioides sp. zg-1308 TaxID=2736253 RepID=UPI001553544D|nr:ATP-binding cassette domain-containing protein [Nocardioides sp. zg-1308]NPD06605.1 ATP-binding cassette domain-containing protein [Nocardioides sp. zg-1308]